MLPHVVKDNRSFHNMARELSSSTSRKGKAARPKSAPAKIKSHPKDFSGSSERPVDSHPDQWEYRKPSSKDGKARNDRISAVTDVPDPVPDTGTPPTSAHSDSQVVWRTFVLPTVNVSTGAAGPTLTTLTMSQPTSVPAALATPFSIPGSMLASSFSVFSYTIPSSSVHSSGTVSAASTTERANVNASQQPDELRRHSVPAIVGLSIGAAFALLGFILVIRTCSRPNKRKFLKPSLPIPIIQEPYESQYDGDGSPLFGGKERLSELKSDANSPSNGTPWQWTQYTEPLKPAPVASWGKGTRTDEVANVMTFNEKSTSANKKISGNNDNSLAAPPLQQVQTAMTRVASRLSTASMSLYPGTPMSGDVGLAIDGVTSFTADGHPVMNKRGAKEKMPPRSRSSIVIGREKARDSTRTRYSDGFAYEGADVSSPVQLQTATHVKLPTLISSTSANGAGGRARIKSSYFASGVYPRGSALSSEDGIRQSTSRGPELVSVKEKRQSLTRSESRRERDTQALASGSRTSDMQPSPQPTIYPDDSMSIAAGDFKRPPKSSTSRNQKKPVPKYNPQTDKTVVVPDSSTSLGSLMLADYGAVANLGREGAEGIPPSSSTSSAKFKRIDDKPPRVPSPPPMPSLAQMALQHTNPEAYTDYRSPTYSIYGLYETDRKSRMTSMG